MELRKLKVRVSTGACFTKAVASTIQRPVALRANADVLRGCLRTE